MKADSVKLRADRFSDRKAGHPNPPAAQTILGTIVGDSNMKQIELTQGKVALVDDKDFERLSQWKWHTANYKTKRLSYARRTCPSVNGARPVVLMHRQILNAPKGSEVDHINHNGLDNRQENLRLCSNSQNHQNTLKSAKNTSGYKGVSKHSKANKWVSQIYVKRQVVYLGYYDSIIDAAIAYDEAAIKYFGEFACTNFGEDTNAQTH